MVMGGHSNYTERPRPRQLDETETPIRDRDRTGPPPRRQLQKLEKQKLASAYPDHARGGEAPSSVIVVCRSRIQDQVAVAVGGDRDVAVAVAGLTKRFLNHIQKDFLINVWGIILHL